MTINHDNYNLSGKYPITHLQPIVHLQPLCSIVGIGGPGYILIGTVGILLATVVPSASGYTVTFYVNNVQKGQSTTDSKGEASFSWDTSGASPGNYSIKAVVNPGGCTSSTITINLYNPTCTTSLSVNPTTTEQGGIITLVATTDISPIESYRASFYDEDGAIASGLSIGYDGKVTWQWNTSGARIGTHNVHAAVYSPTTLPSIKCISTAKTVTITDATCVLSLDVSPGIVISGETVTLTAAATPPGTYGITFKDGTTPIFSLISNSSGVAILNWNTSGVSPGIHTVLVEIDAPVQCAKTGAVIISPQCTDITLTPSVTSIIQNGSVDLTINVLPKGYHQIDIYDGTTFLYGTITDSEGAVTSRWDTTSTTTIGSHSITAKTKDLRPCTSTPSIIDVSTTDCSIGLTLSSPSVAVGNTVTMTAAITPAGQYDMNFKDGDTLLNPTPIRSNTSGIASFGWNTAGQTIGPHNLKALTIPTASTPICISPMKILTIDPPPCTELTLSLPTTATTGSIVQLLAFVTPPGYIYNVRFNIDGILVAAMPTDSNGIAKYDWIAVAGLHSILANIGVPTQCSGASTINVIGPTLQSIAISPVEISLDIGSTRQLTSTCYDQYNKAIVCPTLTWSSSNTLVADVSPIGLITAKSTGTTDITASSGTITSNIAKVTVATTACSSVGKVMAYPSSPLTNNSTILSATVIPSSPGRLTVEFIDANTNTILATGMTCDTSTTKNTCSVVWTPTKAKTYNIKARIGTQCTSSLATTVTARESAAAPGFGVAEAAIVIGLGAGIAYLTTRRPKI